MSLLQRTVETMPTMKTLSVHAFAFSFHVCNYNFVFWSSAWLINEYFNINLEWKLARIWRLIAMLSHHEIGVLPYFLRNNYILSIHKCVRSSFKMHFDYILNAFFRCCSLRNWLHFECRVEAGVRNKFVLKILLRISSVHGNRIYCWWKNVKPFLFVIFGIHCESWLINETMFIVSVIAC